jgi:capsid portal protein
MKTCNICKIEKDLSDFTIRKEGTYRNECKKCRILYLREYRKNNKNNPYKLEPKTTKICRVCNNEKPVDNFIKGKRICTICQKEYLKKRYLDKKESLSIQSKIKYELNKEEIKKRNGEYSKITEKR